MRESFLLRVPPYPICPRVARCISPLPRAAALQQPAPRKLITLAPVFVAGCHHPGSEQSCIRNVLTCTADRVRVHALPALPPARDTSIRKSSGLNQTSYLPLRQTATVAVIMNAALSPRLQSRVGHVHTALVTKLSKRFARTPEESLPPLTPPSFRRLDSRSSGSFSPARSHSDDTPVKIAAKIASSLPPVPARTSTIGVALSADTPLATRSENRIQDRRRVFSSPEFHRQPCRDLRTTSRDVIQLADFV